MSRQDSSHNIDSILSASLPGSPNRNPAQSASSASFIDNDIPKVLARNSACHQCRKRKLKCDAVKPICTNCQKPRQRGTNKNDHPSDNEACSWDEPKEPSARTRRRRESAKRQALAAEQERRFEDDHEVSVKKAKLNELEGRIAACHTALEDQKQGLGHSTFGMNGSSAHIHGNAPSTIYDGSSSAYIPSSNNLQFSQNGPPYNAQSIMSASTSVAENPMQNQHNSNHGSWPNTSSFYVGATEVATPGNESGESQIKHDQNILHSYNDPSQADPLAGFFDLIWPDWPKDLPKYEVVEHMTRVFFEKVPTLPRMLNKNRLLQNLMLPPSHRDFPTQPLLHAILAVTSNFISETSLATRAYFPVGASTNEYTHPTKDFDGSASEPHFNFTSSSAARRPESLTPLSRFQLWHRRKAFQTFSACIDRGDRFLTCMQAYIIATTVDQYNAWWTDLWMETGSCIRMATPMRINESPNVPENNLSRGANSLLPPATSDTEQAERDRTWWMAYLLERSVAASTTWPSSLSEDEVTVELPVLQSTYDIGFGEMTGVQTLLSPDIYTNHPPRHRDSFCLLVKSLKLYTEVQIFFRRYSRGTHSIAGYLSHPTFRVLLSQINTFRMSFPPEFRRPTHFKAGQGVEAFDRDLIQALWILHTASICLGEPLVTKDTWTHEGARMTLAAIRAALSLLYDITATSYDLTLFGPHSCFTWSLAARGLLRFIEAASQAGDPVSASVFRSEVEVFRLAIQRYSERFPIAVKHLRIIDDLMTQMESQPRDGKPLTVLYNCSMEDIVASGRPVGAYVTVSETASTQTMVTPNGSSGLTPDEQAPTVSPINDQSRSTNLNVKPVDNMAVPGSAPPVFMDRGIQDSWNINSFSFDINAMVSLFESNGGVFDGSQFVMPNQ
ncbi:hypothetical protein I302_104430 [Kwoniella bestiolae CBS 10118]|uniref:Zn(2)-C6 fungal-type domain-containing protein n=1 Tax=Kwoniella bestiolae CBS 10118 TaxID=1296100 RepID=A0A1B9GBA4_9TREE|nr:hypothetical protein I302_03135 [Kwoniella bestiolae CBS 10118]OCF28279.1 hypothetical protein I302_03135 [Kwoniella bestiolae CBS 10118]